MKSLTKNELTGAEGLSVLVERNHMSLHQHQALHSCWLKNYCVGKKTIADIKNGWWIMKQVSSNYTASKQGAIHQLGLQRNWHWVLCYPLSLVTCGTV